jgi:hypothetical protein
MATRGTHRIRQRFVGAGALTTTPQGELGLTIKDTSSGGTPTYTHVSGEGLVLTMAATSEAEVLTVYQNNVLPFLLSGLRRVSWTLKVAAFDAVTTLVAGVGSAQDDDPDAVAKNAWLKVIGAASAPHAIVAESDDAVTDTDDQATGKTITSTLKKLTIDFSAGLSKVRCTVDGEPVGPDLNLSGAGATDKVQLFLQIQKASGTGVGAVTIREVEVEYAYSDG